MGQVGASHTRRKQVISPNLPERTIIFDVDVVQSDINDEMVSKQATRCGEAGDCGEPRPD
jgi:hypothetical protein